MIHYIKRGQLCLDHHPSNQNSINESKRIEDGFSSVIFNLGTESGVNVGSHEALKIPNP